MEVRASKNYSKSSIGVKIYDIPIWTSEVQPSKALVKRHSLSQNNIIFQ